MQKNKVIQLRKIAVKNHAVLEDMIIEFNGLTTQIIGMNGSGKSSIVSTIEQAFRGMSEKSKKFAFGDRFQFIGNNGKSLGLQITLVDTARNNAEIIVERKITASGNGKLTFKAPDDYPIDHEWLTNLLKTSFLSVNHFTALSSKEHALLLGIDTAEFDAKSKDLKELYTGINGKITAAGTIEEVVKVEAVDIDKLLADKVKAKERFDKQYEKNKSDNGELRKAYELAVFAAQKEAQQFNGQQKVLGDARSDVAELINKIEADIFELSKYGFVGKIDIAEAQKWLESLPAPKPPKNWQNIELPEPKYILEMPDDSKIQKLDSQIGTAHGTNSEAGKYDAYLERVKKLEELKDSLAANKLEQEKLEQERAKFIKSHKLPFGGLSINEAGELLYNGREIRAPYFSTGELIKIVAQLFASQNDEFKLIFLDDFDLLDKENQHIILKTLLEKGYQVVFCTVGRATPGENTVSLSLPIEDEKTALPSMA